MAKLILQFYPEEFFHAVKNDFKVFGELSALAVASSQS